MVENEIREIKIVDPVARHPQYTRLGKVIDFFPIVGLHQLGG